VRKREQGKSTPSVSREEHLVTGKYLREERNKRGKNQAPGRRKTDRGERKLKMSWVKTDQGKKKLWAPDVL